MGTFSGNVEEGREHTQGVSEVYYGEAIAPVIRHDMGDSQGGSSAVSGSNSVGDDLYRETTGNCGIVGGVALNI